jgi:5-methylcytosine-specific restriction endonuclease McrA
MLLDRNCPKCAEPRALDDFRKHPITLVPRGNCRECEREYQRSRYAANPERGRDRAARSMRKLRSDPTRHASHLDKQRIYYHAKAKHREKEYHQAIKATQPWEWRARNLRRNINVGITVDWLRSKWDDQNGHCSLTGRELDIRTFHVDHIVPASRGGSDDLSNLRLLSPEANASKHGLKDEEFIALCADVVAKAQIPEMIARRIKQALESEEE